MSGRNMFKRGDEIGALVFDIGHHSLRVGYAQEPLPRHEIPGAVGVCEDSDGNSAAASDGMNLQDKMDSNITSNKTYYMGTTPLNVPRKGMEIVSYMKDGVIDDWDLFEKVLDYTYTKCIKSESKNHPVLMSESPWNPRNKREKLIEIMFEKYNVPAFFLVKNAVLAAFANGKPTSLVVDSGATHTSVVPVKDGHVITEGIVKSPIGGDYISMQCKQYLQNNNIEVVPIYMIGSKEPVNEKVRANWTKKNNIPDVTMSWHNYMVKNVIQDFQNCVLQVSEEPYDENDTESMPEVHYEFPHGYNQKFGVERFKIAEAMFDPSSAPGYEDTMLSVDHIFMTSIGMCDPIIRSALYKGVVVTGGNSLIRGFPERLRMDVSMMIPSRMKRKLKVTSASGSAERKFGSWIGGSMLVSNRTFQQFWISSQEYQEEGKGQIHWKCP